MNAIEIRGLAKTFGEKSALAGLDMTVPVGAIYGFIGENGSGKSTTEKIICGLIHPSGGEVKLFGKSYTDMGVRAKLASLIEAPGCFPNLSVWTNMLLAADNLGLADAEAEVVRALKTVRMEGSASSKFKNCSLGMKQRIGIAMALLGDPELLILDEPINGLDADGMRIMREVLTDIVASGRTVVISSHILGELEKIATHYGIIRGGRMIAEMSAEELDASCRSYVKLKARDMKRAVTLLGERYKRVEEDEAGYARVYDEIAPAEAVRYLHSRGTTPYEVGTDKISLEEYYIELMKEGRK